MDAKREMARRLLEGDGVDKDEAKAVSLLEESVAHGNADAMVMLAKCCALGRGMEHDAERAEALVSEAAKKGNHEARILLRIINSWNGKESIYSQFHFNVTILHINLTILKFLRFGLTKKLPSCKIEMILSRNL